MKKKLWFCMQKLNKTNLVDLGSTKVTWATMWLPFLMAFLKAVSDERFFISLGTSSQILDDSVPCKTANWPRIESGPVSSVIHSHVTEFKTITDRLQR